ncbi:MAG: aldehyde dehydrogenase family protein [Chthoniobacterales bacterium]|nr:aldehyde dehydrogenase family protein [Chthoniobacterales bacterium]
MIAEIAAARQAQRKWEAEPLRRRLEVVRRLRLAIAVEATALARLAAAPNDRPVAEKLVSEVIPLLDACRFLEKNASWILREKRHGARGRPLWLRGSSFVVRRKPFGVVLVVGPGNYPLFLPAVQLLQALVAGNAVLVKPAENCSASLGWLRAHMSIAPNLVQLLPEPPESARAAVRAGVDKVVFTGSSENGRSLLAIMAERNTPGVFELSGADSVFVRQDADLLRAAKAIDFGRRLNAGNTCMAPQFVFAHANVVKRLREMLEADIEVRSFSSDAEALESARAAEFGLGASIFSADEMAARAFAQQLPTGFVTINDMIVATADPRFPFGGVRASGFGTTRGAEGLLEMTYPHVVATRRGRSLPHLGKSHPADAALFAAYIRNAYGRRSWSSARELIRVARKRRA